jgi:hypothetical protein
MASLQYLLVTGKKKSIVICVCVLIIKKLRYCCDAFFSPVTLLFSNSGNSQDATLPVIKDIFFLMPMHLFFLTNNTHN